VRARAQVTRAALLKAGRTLLETHDFHAMSVAAIAAAHGMSVGSFYGRFKDKEAFFEELQREITAEWIEEAARTLEHGAGRGLTATQLVHRVCKTVARLIHQDAGFLRAALKHEATNPAGWAPIKQAGKEVATLAIDVLRPALPPDAVASSVTRIRFALQVLYSTCFNGILHDPGPIPVGNTRLERELARMMCLYLGLPPDSPQGVAHAATRGSSKARSAAHSPSSPPEQP
jgi:AcrR family transcriptional regulator